MGIFFCCEERRDSACHHHIIIALMGTDCAGNCLALYFLIFVMTLSGRYFGCPQFTDGNTGMEGKDLLWGRKEEEEENRWMVGLRVLGLYLVFLC